MDDPHTIAAQWLNDADAVIICAGAGMSANNGYNVYVSEDDFSRHYPWFKRWGYNTAYECMGLLMDKKVPIEAKWGWWANHFNNMRFKFPVADQYTQLFDMVKEKDCFVYTSNVDGSFARAGFAPEKIYTPQGDMAFYQCVQRCSPASVFECRPLLDAILPLVDDEGVLPESSVPKCSRCGGDVFGNLRGGDWFIHQKYDVANRNFVNWVEAKANAACKVVVLEVGAGFNTPTVTRFPMEAIARELSDAGGSLVRVNPTEPDVPSDIPRAVGIAEGCDAISQIQAKMKELADANGEASLTAANTGGRRKMTAPADFSWRAMMDNLRR